MINHARKWAGCASALKWDKLLFFLSRKIRSHCQMLNKKRNNHFGENSSNLFPQLCAYIIIKVHRNICCSCNCSSGFQLHIVQLTSAGTLSWLPCTDNTPNLANKNDTMSKAVAAWSTLLARVCCEHFQKFRFNLNLENQLLSELLNELSVFKRSTATFVYRC